MLYDKRTVYSEHIRDNEIITLKRVSDEQVQENKVEKLLGNVTHIKKPQPKESETKKATQKEGKLKNKTPFNAKPYEPKPEKKKKTVPFVESFTPEDAREGQFIIKIKYNGNDKYRQTVWPDKHISSIIRQFLKEQNIYDNASNYDIFCDDLILDSTATIKQEGIKPNDTLYIKKHLNNFKHILLSQQRNLYGVNRNQLSLHQK